jgi:hypothetical protein
MAGTFISFWNAAYVDSPVLLNGTQKISFWVLLNFIESEISSHSELSVDDGCASLVSGAHHVNTLDFSTLSDDVTRHFRVALAEWAERSHGYWKTPIPWSALGGFGVTVYKPEEAQEAECISETARELGTMVSQNLVCSDYN